MTALTVLEQRNLLFPTVPIGTILARMKLSTFVQLRIITTYQEDIVISKHNTIETFSELIDLVLYGDKAASDFIDDAGLGESLDYRRNRTITCRIVIDYATPESDTGDVSTYREVFRKLPIPDYYIQDTFARSNERYYLEQRTIDVVPEVQDVYDHFTYNVFDTATDAEIIAAYDHEWGPQGAKFRRFMKLSVLPTLFFTNTRYWAIQNNKIIALLTF